jgi:peptidyl-prolyl cis-trans isomerase B (cyclophilin B)
LKNPVATIELDNGGIITAELYPDKAPNTVNNFIALANKGFYDGLIFHRVIPGFVIQGGDPNGTGVGGPGYSIKGEFKDNGFAKNDLKHTVGVLSMARSQSPNSAGSQFFIMVGDSPHLDGGYAAFGRVSSGMEHAQAIAAAKRGPGDRPVQDQRIKKITMELFGQTYPEPEKVK